MLRGGDHVQSHNGHFHGDGGARFLWFLLRGLLLWGQAAEWGWAGAGGLPWGPAGACAGADADKEQASAATAANLSEIELNARFAFPSPPGASKMRRVLFN